MMNETAKRNKKIKVLNVGEFIQPIRKSEPIWKEISKTIQKDCTFDTAVETFSKWNRTKKGGEVCLNIYVPQYVESKKTGRELKLCGITVQAIWNDWQLCDYVRHYDIIGGKEFVPGNIISKIPCEFIDHVLNEVIQTLKKKYENEDWRKFIAESYTTDERKYLYNNGEFCEFCTDYNIHLEDNLTAFCNFVKDAIKVKGDISKANTSALNNIYKQYDKITEHKKDKMFKKYVNATYETIEYLNFINKELASNLNKMMNSNTNAYIFLNAIVFDRRSYVYVYDKYIDKQTFAEFTSKLHSLACRYGIRYTIKKDFLCTREYKADDYKYRSYVKPENEKK